MQTLPKLHKLKKSEEFETPIDKKTGKRQFRFYSYAWKDPVLSAKLRESHLGKKMNFSEKHLQYLRERTLFNKSQPGYYKRKSAKAIEKQKENIKKKDPFYRVDGIYEEVVHKDRINTHCGVCVGGFNA